MLLCGVSVTSVTTNVTTSVTLFNNVTQMNFEILHAIVVLLFFTKVT